MITVMVLFLVLGGCSVKETEQKKDSVRHMIKSEKLHLLMRELDMVVYERQKSELDRDRLRKRYVLNLAQTIKELSSELEKIKTQDDAEVYKKHAKLLEQSSNSLRLTAERYEFEMLDQNLQELKNICNSCHKHFRVEH